MQVIQNRRDFLAGVSVAAGAGVLGPRAPLGADGAIGNDHVRLRRDPPICVAPWY